jgi:oxygen-independent coproporphyrinogen-3 oxidase
MEGAESGTVERDGTEELSREQAAGEFVFLALRRSAGLDADAFRARFGEELESAFPVLSTLTRDGLIERTPVGWRLSEGGLLVADSVFPLFF